MSKPLYAVSTETSHVLRCRVRLGLVPPGEKGDKKKGKGNPGAGFSNERADQHAHAVGDAGMQDGLIGWPMQSMHGNIGRPVRCKAHARRRGGGIGHLRSGAIGLF